MNTQTVSARASEIETICAAAHAKRVEAFRAVKASFVPGAKVQTPYGVAVVAPPVREAADVATIRVQWSDGKIGRFVPSALKLL